MLRDKIEQSFAAEGACWVGSEGLCVYAPGFSSLLETEMALKLGGKI